ncbi:cytochrome P450 71A1-like [Magnolia sinica]|uniref:cytochrome P450 71A1-like n=1 Tax=Magnolia sinica TaxID=86752 RepID=UPI002657E3B5|nr:cytochrome P450 71A1-like [Magnolia sinica]XP_058089140.1 cytochrome P450 71A1-like [Magnolia sinica]
MAIFPALLFLVFAIVLLTLATFNGGRARNKTNQPPSPSKLPIIGNLHQLGGPNSLLHLSLRSLSDKHGPLMLLHMGSIATLVVSSAEMAEEILKTHDLVFASRPWPCSNAAKQLLYGCNDLAFSPYGEYWRQVRKICVIELLSGKRVQSFTFIREEEVRNMTEVIKDSCSISAVNLTDMFLSLLSSIVSRVAFGKKYTGGENGEIRFSDLAKELQVLLGSFSVGDYFPSFGWMDVLSGLDARLKRISQGMDDFLDQVIEDHLIRGNVNNDGNNDERKDLVDVLLHLQKDANADIHLTKDNLKAIILDMFVAGTDTGSIALEWTMAELAKNPHVMEKAQAEVRRVVGRKAKVEEDDLVHMDYLKSIIKEALRLHPPAPLLIPHESTTSVTLQGYHISAKTKVLINAWAIGRDPKSWENADEFLPERFTNNPIDFRGQDFQLIPFGAGRRSCPGMPFVISTMELALANLLYWFDWELPGGAKNEDLDMSEVPGIVVHMKFPLQLVPIYHFSS